MSSVTTISGTESVEKVTSAFSQVELSAPVLSDAAVKQSVSLAPPPLSQNLDDRFLRWAHLGDITPVAPATETLVVTLNTAGYFSSPVIAESIRGAHGFVGSLEVMILSSIPAGCSGLFYACIHPQCGITDTTPSNSQFPENLYFSCFQKEGQFVDCCAATDIVLKVPYTSPKTYSLFTEPQGLLQFWCCSPPAMATDGSAPTTTFRVYMRAGPDFRLINPSLQSAKALVPLSYARATSSALRTTASAIDFVAGTVLNGHSVVPSSGGVTRTLSQLPSMSNVEGVDPSASVSLTPASGVRLVDPDLSIDSITSRWTHRATINWPTTTASGTILGVMPVVPTNGFSFASPEPFVNLSPAGQICFGFEHWRGTNHYKFFVPASSFHRGTLQVSWVPGTTYTPSTRDPTPIAPNVLYEVSAGESLEIEVGYAAQTPYLRANFLTSLQANVAIDGLGSANGFLIISVATKLTAPVAGSVDIVVLQAMTDLEVNGISPCVDSEYFSWPIWGVRTQSATVGNAPHIERKVTLVKPAPRLGAAISGYDVTSLRSLLQGMSVSNSAKFTTTETTNRIGVVLHTGSSIAERTAGGWDSAMQLDFSSPYNTIPIYQDLLLAMFCGYIGTSRYQLAFEGVKGVMLLGTAYDFPNMTTTTWATDEVYPMYTGVFCPMDEFSTTPICVSMPLTLSQCYEFSGAAKTAYVSDALRLYVFYKYCQFENNSGVVVSKGYGADVSPVIFRCSTRVKLTTALRFPPV